MIATSTPEMTRIKGDTERKKAKNRRKNTTAKKLFLDNDSDSDNISVSDLRMRDDSESENEDENVLQLHLVENVSVDDYVVVEFAKKTRLSYFIGRVTKEKDEDDDVEIDFYRRKGGYFIKPTVQDLSVVHIDNIKAILPMPNVRGSTNRTKGELVFTTNFGDINLC